MWNTSCRNAAEISAWFKNGDNTAARRCAAVALSVLAWLILVFPSLAGADQVVTLKAKDTLTAVEMNHGDELRFTLRSGRTVALVLEDTEAAIVERVAPGGIVYQFSCRLRVDGQPITLRRFVCSQECFYEPYVVAGLRIWPDIVKEVFDLVPVRYPREGNLQCVPRKDARFALQDATLRICPEPILPWLDEPQDFIDVGRCYNGDDCYLGPYLGQACHVGMDINHPKGSLLLSPIDFDTQAWFNSLAMGHNNNRWRGVRRWPNGDVWALQTHHLVELLVPENTPLSAGAKYATTAGVHVGSHEHTHFEFKIGHKHPDNPLPAGADPASIACPINFDDDSEAAQANPEVLHLDPWIVFWQSFEDRKARRGSITAAMKPPATATTGEPVVFSAEGSSAGSDGRGLFFVWTFGDGGCAVGRESRHVFAQPGVYPVTLVVDDGQGRAACTHHIVVSGEPVTTPVLALAAPDEPSFRTRPAHVADVYGLSVQFVPHTLQFVAGSGRPAQSRRPLLLRNLGGGALPQAAAPGVVYNGRPGWLKVDLAGAADSQSFHVDVDASGLAQGHYAATVTINCPGAVNSPQTFRVVLNVRGTPPAESAVIDNRDDGFYATPYFWVGHRFCRCPAARRGYGSFYLTNGEQATPGEFARFTPDLKSGTYQVSLSKATPFRAGTEFDVRVRHRGGEATVRVAPEKSRQIGIFEFDGAGDHFVEILAAGSKGLVMADAVIFERELRSGQTLRDEP